MRVCGDGIVFPNFFKFGWLSLRGKKKTGKEEHGSEPCGSSEAAGLGMLVPFCSLSHALGLLQPDREAQNRACSPKETIRRNAGRCIGTGLLFSYLVISDSL